MRHTWAAGVGRAGARVLTCRRRWGRPAAAAPWRGRLSPAPGSVCPARWSAAGSSASPAPGPTGTVRGRAWDGSPEETAGRAGHRSFSRLGDGLPRHDWGVASADEGGLTGTSSKDQGGTRFSTPWRREDNTWYCVGMDPTCSEDVQTCSEHQDPDLFYGVITCSMQRVWDRREKSIQRRERFNFKA